MQALVSIIVPVFNRCDIIVDTLSSISNQSHSNWECIIIDDRSTDNTKLVVNEFIKFDSRFILLDRPLNKKKGANSCRNYGFSISQGDFVVWFDSDDIMPEDSISSRVKLLIDSKFDFIIGRLSNFNSLTNEIFNLKKNNLFPITDNPAQEYLLGDYWFQTSIPLFRSSFLRKFNKHFDESISFHDEGEFFIRILLSSPSIYFTDQLVTLRRMHKISVSNIYNNQDEPYKLFQDHFGSLKIWHAFLKSKIYYDESIHLYFKYFFYRWCLKMKYDAKRLLIILILGLRYKMFQTPFKVINIVFWRIIHRK